MNGGETHPQQTTVFCTLANPNRNHRAGRTPYLWLLARRGCRRCERAEARGNFFFVVIVKP